MQIEKLKKFILAKLRKELPKYLTYHSISHIKDVYEAAGVLAKLENITGDQLTLLLTAALLHDAGFLIQQKDHERIAGEIARKYLPDFNYLPHQIEVVCSMIMATHMPQTPTNLLEEIICDADLNYLGTDSFFTIGGRLFDELTTYGVVSNEDEWNRMQIKFLEKHHYFTASAKKLRDQKKADNLAILKSKVIKPM